METAGKFKLLIVDDENASLKQLTGILSSDYIIITAVTGNNAVEKAKEYKPDLILFDMFLPVVNGYDTLAELKKNNDLGAIPVIFITDHESEEFDESVISFGPVDFIIKPFNVSIVKMRVRNQIKLISAAALSETVNREKLMFFSMLSHEIRTPLNAILGISAMQFQKESISQDISNAFSRIYDSGGLLLGIINDIVDISMIEAGKLEITIAQYNVASVINDTINQNLAKYADKNLKLTVNIDENIPSLLSGDEARIRQIINNLLVNALRLTSSGEIELSVSCETNAASLPLDGKNVSLIINVRDTGQGMTEEQIKNLSKFYSGNFLPVKPGENSEGASLRGKLRSIMRLDDVLFNGSLNPGMIMIHNLVSMMGGEVDISCKPGIETSFTVRLVQGDTGAKPLGAETAAKLMDLKSYNDIKNSKNHIAREGIKAGKVLIVDDVDINLYVAKEMLSPYGLDIDLAVSGEEALEFIKCKNYDLVFMDHIMPVMDGIETTNEIRKMGYNKLPIIALTANAISGVKELFFNNGFNGFISKPIGLYDLDGILRQWMLPAAVTR